MQFKQPEILYFLLCLIVPIIVHLFQLQKFKKVPFSNVAFLQKIALKNRQSSTLKKWLILATRLLLFSGIIIAFSQPYFSSEIYSKKHHTFIYLDNSVSMSAKGKKGELFLNTVQDLIENSFENDSYSLLTNSDLFENLNANELKENLLSRKISGLSSSFERILLQINSHFNNKTKTLNKYILISDFQNFNKNIFVDFTNVTPPISLVQLRVEQNQNLSIDSLYLEPKTNNDFELFAVIKNQGAEQENIPIAIFEDETPIAKQSFSIDKNQTKTLRFPIQNRPNFHGKISLELDDVFSHDNSLFFAIKSDQKIKVLNLGKSADFLSKIYEKNEFDFSQSSVQNINYSSAENQNLIVLNELEEISNSLREFIVKFLKNGGSVVVIPNSEINMSSYNQLLKQLELSAIEKGPKDSLKITNINYTHPFFKGVFEKTVQNFQYPYSLINFWIRTNAQNELLQLENKKAFITAFPIGKANFYWVSSPLSLNNSNFIISPLVVPVFYNFAKNSLRKPTTYAILGSEITVDINTRISKDKVLTVEKPGSSFIPLQQSYPNKVSLTFKDQPSIAGLYTVQNDQQYIQHIAFNYSNTESSLKYLDLKELILNNSKLTVTDSVKELLQENYKKNEVTWLWKWFLSLAIVSLFFEILILKLFKP